MFDKRLLLAIPFFCLSGLALAGSTSYETARVVDVQPIVDIERTPVDCEVCRQQEALVEKRHSHTPTSLGAIVGGVVGSQVGGGSGRRAATVAGPALGGSIAHDSSSGKRVVPSTRTQCHAGRTWRERTVERGYRVTYEYNGRLHRTTMNHPPGDTIQVRVSVEPSGY